MSLVDDFREIDKMYNNLQKFDYLKKVNNQIKKYENELLYGQHTYNALVNAFDCDSNVYAFIENKNTILSYIRSLEGMLHDMKEFVDNV